MIFTKEKLEKYVAQGDIISDMLDDTGKIYTSHRWLLESLPKRAIYYSIYGDLLKPGKPKRVLDVGGGYSSLSEILIKHHDYQLLDIMVHDNTDGLGNFLIKEDWYQFSPDNYDIVIANDLFPNVDQRLELFLDKYFPIAKEIRMSLTDYNTPKFYTTKRVDADEIFCQLAYSGRQVRDILSRFFHKDFDELLQEQPSLFSNGRQIKILKEGPE